MTDRRDFDPEAPGRQPVLTPIPGRSPVLVRALRSQCSREDLRLLGECFNLLMDNSEVIRATPRLAGCYSPAWRFGGVPVGVREYLSLGVLLRLWEQGSLTMECPHCGSEAMIYFVVGSYLSGRNHAQGYCPGCDHLVTRAAPEARTLGRFRRVLGEASQLVNLGGGLPLGASTAPPRLLFPKELEPPREGIASLSMVIAELSA